VKESAYAHFLAAQLRLNEFFSEGENNNPLRHLPYISLILIPAVGLLLYCLQRKFLKLKAMGDLMYSVIQEFKYGKATVDHLKIEGWKAKATAQSFDEAYKLSPNHLHKGEHGGR